jgi:methylphosphotriester-DNA--protein-cysteine methyltransferase
MATRGRPKVEFDKKTFVDLVGLGCNQEEICWFFRDIKGKPANVDTLSRWCKREFGVNFQEYYRQNRYHALKIQLRRNQFELSKRSAAMAIFLGKNYLGQKDVIEQIGKDASVEVLNEIAEEIKKVREDERRKKTESVASTS